jgi:hypothetical protein
MVDRAGGMSALSWTFVQPEAGGAAQAFDGGETAR